MLCDLCNQNPATVHITKIVNGKKEEMNICEKCAKEKEGFGIAGDIGFDTPFSFQNILSGFMGYGGQAAQNTRNEELVCKNCGTSYSDFKKSGLLGCSECYTNFSNILMPVVKRVQGNIEHAGKLPKKAGREIIEKKKLNQLKSELQKAIQAEEYEKAAQIRDVIRELQQEK